MSKYVASFFFQYKKKKGVIRIMDHLTPLFIIFYSGVL